MTKSWVSGGKNVDLIEKLRREVSELEATRDELVESNKKRVFDWSSFMLNSPLAPRDVNGLRENSSTLEVKEILVRYEHMNQEIMEKQARLNEKLDEQAKFDSLG